MTARRIPSPVSGLPRLLGLFGLLGSALGCATQRVPGPLFLPDDAAPLPTSTAAGLTVQPVVMRHSDTVAIRPPGEMGSRVLTFYRKRVRVEPGTWVLTQAEGKAEVLWPGDASSLLLLGEGAVELGDPGREEPLFTFHDVERARLTLTPEDRVRFPGGGELRGDPVVPSGPFLVERLSAELLRITNRSKRDAQLSYAGEILDLAAGYERELPVLAARTGSDRTGSRGSGRGPEMEKLEGAGIRVSATGALTRLDGRGALGFEAGGPSELHALGVRVHLESGERVTFSNLGAPDEVPDSMPASSGEPR